MVRAFASNPRILLLDELTSALDNNTQSTVTASRKRRSVTRIAIADWLSTIQDADRNLLSNRKCYGSAAFKIVGNGCVVFFIKRHETVDAEHRAAFFIDIIYGLGKDIAQH